MAWEKEEEETGGSNEEKKEEGEKEDSPFFFNGHFGFLGGFLLHFYDKIIRKLL